MSLGESVNDLLRKGMIDQMMKWITDGVEVIGPDGLPVVGQDGKVMRREARPGEVDKILKYLGNKNVSAHPDYDADVKQLETELSRRGMKFEGREVPQSLRDLEVDDEAEAV